MDNAKVLLLVLVAVEVAFIGYIFVQIFFLGFKLWRSWLENRALDRLLSTPEGKKRYEDAVIAKWKSDGRIDVDVQVLSKDLRGDMPKWNFSPELNKRLEKWWKNR